MIFVTIRHLHFGQQILGAAMPESDTAENEHSHPRTSAASGDVEAPPLCATYSSVFTKSTSTTETNI